MAKKKSKRPSATSTTPPSPASLWNVNVMLGTMRIQLTFQVAEVQDQFGNSVFVLHRAALDYLGIRQRWPFCNWFAGSGHLCFLSRVEKDLVEKCFYDYNVELATFGGVWNLEDDPGTAGMSVVDWAEACCKDKHPHGKRKINLARKNRVTLKQINFNLPEIKTMIRQRAATPQDLEFITNLAHSFDRFGPYVQVFEDMLLGNHAALQPQGVIGNVQLFIHEDDEEQPNGFVAVEWKKNGVEGHIHGVAVEERYRRQGVANHLLDCVEKLARERGILRLESITAETDNAPALSCFTQWGFENLGFVGNYPEGQRAVRLLRTL